MSERYTKLFSLPENLYKEGSPVIVSAGNLLKDNRTGKILVQLKIKNIEKKAVKAAKVLICPKDITGTSIDSECEYEFLDFLAKQGEEFGQKKAIQIENNSTREFSVKVLKVVFTDNSVWSDSSETKLEPLPSSKPLEDVLISIELAKQYRIKYGTDSKIMPQRYLDIWQCKCGEWNASDTCFNCGQADSILTSNIQELKDACDKRLEEERQENEEKQRQYKEEKALKDAHKKRTKKSIGLITTLILSLVAIVLLYNNVFVPLHKYNEAKELFERGQYTKAYLAFRELGDYKDSEDRSKEALSASVYAAAERDLKNDDYDSALTGFLSCGSYKDSKSRVEEVRELINDRNYHDAIELFRTEQFEEAWTIFDALGDYKDAKRSAQTARYEYAKHLFYDLKQYEDAKTILSEIEDYEHFNDAAALIMRCDLFITKEIYEEATELLENGKYQMAAERFETIADYEDSKELAMQSVSLWCSRREQDFDFAEEFFVRNFSWYTPMAEDEIRTALDSARTLGWHSKELGITHRDGYYELMPRSSSRTDYYDISFVDGEFRIYDVFKATGASVRRRKSSYTAYQWYKMTDKVFFTIAKKNGSFEAPISDASVGYFLLWY